ncbi:hypothetical protein L227DRAFT_562977 [Lentinus tigrinus ALCF2SS1-6]|uniref:Uncharacterized protein n=1 Tax=Lentinus tigrinus ALCF2SS1-6 TaxID=1328759 RepID=A0A5C2SJB2_9APHY|nr:hypothetical protein L227DRAFT_562977 [Lentinus tigrinus ALCF2SS1-6]
MVALKGGVKKGTRKVVALDVHVAVVLVNTTAVAKTDDCIEYDAGSIIIDGVAEFEVTSVQDHTAMSSIPVNMKYRKLNISNETVASRFDFSHKVRRNISGPDIWRNRSSTRPASISMVGPNTENLTDMGEIKDFVITEGSGSGIAKGFRRVVAVSGHGAVEACRLGDSLAAQLNRIGTIGGAEKNLALRATTVAIKELPQSFEDKFDEPVYSAMLA